MVITTQFVISITPVMNYTAHPLKMNAENDLWVVARVYAVWGLFAVSPRHTLARTLLKVCLKIYTIVQTDRSEPPNSIPVGSALSIKD